MTALENPTPVAERHSLGLNPRENALASGLHGPSLMPPRNIVFVDRTGGVMFRSSYNALSDRYRVIWSDTAENTLSHVARLGLDVHCVVMAADEVTTDDSLLLVSRLRQQGVPVVASCATLGQAIALLSAGAREVLRRPHTTKELVSRVNVASQ